MKRRIFNRLASTARPFWSIRNLEGDEAELRIYEEIGFWEDTTASAFADSLNAIKAGTIHVRINSPGGYIGDAMAIYQQLKDHPARIITHIDGLAASAATYPALAGDEVIINRGGVFMIHDPLSVAMGSADVLRKEAEALDKFKAAIVAVYGAETGNTADKLSKWMADETWFTADEAVSNGFADKLADEGEPAQGNQFDLSLYRNAPAALNAASVLPKTVREMEKYLRDAGLPLAAAKTLASAATSTLDLRDEDAEEAAFIASIRQRWHL